MIENPPSEFLTEIPQMIRDDFVTRIDAGDDVWAYCFIFAQQPLATIQNKGNNNWKTDWLLEFRKRLTQFICGKDLENAKIRDEIIASGKGNAKLIVAAIAGYLAHSLHVSMLVITPMVAMVLYAIGKIGIDAWCSIAENTISV